MFYSRGPKETETQNQQETVFKTKGGNTVNESTGSGIQDLTQSPPPPAPPNPGLVFTRPLCRHLAKMPAVISHHGKGGFQTQNCLSGVPASVGPTRQPPRSKGACCWGPS